MSTERDPPPQTTPPVPHLPDSDAGTPQTQRRRFVPEIPGEDQTIIPGGPARGPARRRGRPAGTKTRITHERLTADEFAVLRAVTQGVDIGVAARQYLLWAGRVPERHNLIAQYRTLLRRIAAAATALPDTQTARRKAAELLRHQRAAGKTSPEGVAQKSGGTLPVPSASAAPPAPAPAARPAARLTLPTLDEFAERFDEGMFSEAELLELYQEEFAEQLQAQAAAKAAPAAASAGAAPVPVAPSGAAAPRPGLSAADRITRALEAIDWLDRHLGTKPDRTQHVDQWVRLTLKQRVALREIGVITLGNLVDWMSLRGQQWYRKHSRERFS